MEQTARPEVIVVMNKRDERTIWRMGWRAWEHLAGKLVRLEFLPTERSRKWRPASLVMFYSENAYHQGGLLRVQEGWYAFRFVPFS